MEHQKGSKMGRFFIEGHRNFLIAKSCEKCESFFTSKHTKAFIFLIAKICEKCEKMRKFFYVETH